MSGRFSLSNGGLYAFLLAGQTVAGAALFMIVFPIFHNVLSHLGERQTLEAADQILITTVAVALHCFYWIRLGRVTVPAPFKSTLVSHFCMFVGRLSFLFGGALFSAVFFRHVPELDVLPPLGQSVIKLSYIALILFGLFCYSLELDRLGKALEPDPQ